MNRTNKRRVSASKIITADIGGAAGPIILKRKKALKELPIIIDNLKGTYDYSKLEQAREKGAQIIKANAEQLPLKNNSVKKLDCRLPYNKGRTANLLMLAVESKRVLKNGGIVTVSVYGPEKEELIREFKEAGFKIEREMKQPITDYERKHTKFVDKEVKKLKELGGLYMGRKIGFLEKSRISIIRFKKG